MTDTPPTPITFPPPDLWDRIKTTVGDLARPFAIIVSNGAASIAVIKIAWTISEKSSSWEGAAMFVGAAGAYAGALFGAKAWEVTKTSGQAADLERARVQASPLPETQPPAVETKS